MRSKAKRAVFFTLLILSGWAIIQFTACQKDTGQNPVQHEEDPTQRIEQFYADMQNWKQGVPNKSGGRISLDSAIWYIDATLNYYYANSNGTSAKFHRDTVYVEMELVSDYEAMYQQVFSSYDESLSGLSEKYHAISGENKRFIMAIVNDAGPLPENKHKLQIVTVSGTGILQSSGDFGESESYFYNRDALYNCDWEIAPGAPIIFETMLSSHFNPPPSGSCHWFFYGSTTELVLEYEDFQLNDPIQNYLDYKIYAASSVIGDGLTDEVKCLEYNQNNSGIHEMQFYYDHLKVFVSDWLASPENTGNMKLAPSVIESRISEGSSGSIFYHRPNLKFRKRGLSCQLQLDIPATD